MSSNYFNFGLVNAVPPGDEDWFCPGCDCKDNCIDVLNDFQGTNISILDKWEVRIQLLFINQNFSFMHSVLLISPAEDLS